MPSPAAEIGEAGIHKMNEGEASETLTKWFWLGKDEVTQREYELIPGKNPRPRRRSQKDILSQRLPAARIFAVVAGPPFLQDEGPAPAARFVHPRAALAMQKLAMQRRDRLAGLRGPFAQAFFGRARGPGRLHEVCVRPAAHPQELFVP